MRMFVWGLLTMACTVAAIFFFHYWRVSRERLFAYFTVAFAAMALDWLGHAFVPDPTNSLRPEVYAVRLFAFIVILIAIIDKNRNARRR
ncbi:MAG: DUF5985 family protein [Steroidobacteraceae bacterium]